MERSIARFVPHFRSKTPSSSASLIILQPPRRSSSSFSHLSSELPARRLPIVYDYLSPVHSHLLNTTLTDYLPPSFAQNYLSTAPDSTTTPASVPNLPSTTQNPGILPPAYHLIYFPPTTPPSLLLPDGTDPLQSPGPPFVRRMWAGGALRFNLSHSPPGSLSLQGQRTACVERIVDVAVKGKEGDEKVFVGIDRRVGACEEGEGEETIRARFGEGEDMGNGVACVERRNIVFMRERGPQKGAPEKGGEKKILKGVYCLFLTSIDGS